VQASNASPPTLIDGSLLPGDERYGRIVVPGERFPVRPFARIDDLVQTCAGFVCRSGRPGLADALVLDIADTAGQHWTGPLRRLVAGVELPGGVIRAGGSRTYALTLSLPVQIGNAYEDMSLVAGLSWYGGNDKGLPETAVLGETFMRPGSASGSASTPTQASLPFTGLDLARFVTLAGLLLCGGGALVVATRRRKRADL
jgi:hypothetical protein